MRVLVIPEDPTLDRYVVKPIVERIFAEIGRTARVDVLTDPHISGASQALDRGLIAEVVLDNPMIDLFLLVVDRDCDRMGHEAKAAARASEHPDKLVAALAWRKKAMRELERGWSGLLQVCPEIAELRDRVRSHLEVHQ